MSDPRRLLRLYYGGNAPEHELWLISAESPPGAWTLPEASMATAAKIRDERGADWAEWVGPEEEPEALREAFWRAQLDGVTRRPDRGVWSGKALVWVGLISLTDADGRKALEALAFAHGLPGGWPMDKPLREAPQAFQLATYSVHMPHRCEATLCLGVDGRWRVSGP